MSSPLSNEPCNRAGLFKWPVRSSASSRWSQALVQNRKQLRVRSFVLAVWPSCRGPRRQWRINLAVVPSATSGPVSSNAWRARPHQTRARYNLQPTSLRAIQGVPNSVMVRALLPVHSLPGTDGAAVLRNTGAESPISYMKVPLRQFVSRESKRGSSVILMCLRVEVFGA